MANTNTTTTLTLTQYESELKSMLLNIDFKDFPEKGNPYRNHFHKTVKSLEPFFRAYGGVTLPLLESSLFLQGFKLEVNLRLLSRSEYIEGKEYKYSSIEYGIGLKSIETGRCLSIDNINFYNEITGFVPDDSRPPLSIEEVVKNVDRALNLNEGGKKGNYGSWESIGDDDGLWGGGF